MTTPIAIEEKRLEIDHADPELGGVTEEIEWPDVPRTAHELTNLRECAFEALGLQDRGSRWMEFKWSDGSRGVGRQYKMSEGFVHRLPYEQRMPHLHTSMKWVRVIVTGRDGRSKVIKRRRSQVTPLHTGEDRLSRRAVEVWSQAVAARNPVLQQILANKLNELQEDDGDLFPGASLSPDAEASHT